MDSEFKKKDFLQLFGRQIDIIRTKKGYSYDKIAKGCKLDDSDISKFSKGRVNVTLSTIMELAKGLDVHPKELFDFDVPLDDKE